MGQKVNPYGFRLGIVKPWRSRWYAKHEYANLIREDSLIRQYLVARLSHAAIADVHIDRKPGKATVTIFTGRPGVVIGKRGAEVAKLRDELAQLTGKDVGINVEGTSMRMGAQGIKIRAAGRLGGAEIARSEGYHEGRVPLHTLRADIDYATATAKTTYGTIGVKVWIFKGEVVEDARGRTYSTGA